jgi:hypothetical protein
VAILDARIRPCKAHSRIDGSSSSTALPVIIKLPLERFGTDSKCGPHQTSEKPNKAKFR